VYAGVGPEVLILGGMGTGMDGSISNGEYKTTDLADCKDRFETG